MFILDLLSDREAMQILTDNLLGKDYIACDTGCKKQANAFIVKKILEKYTGENVELKRGKICLI